MKSLETLPRGIRAGSRRAGNNFVVTKSSTGEDERGDEQTDSKPEAERCQWCRSVLPERRGAGRPRRFCSQRCRQWAWVARQRAGELSLAEGELLVARDELHGLLDDLYVLSCAVVDTQRDLADGLGPESSSAEIFSALEWLLDAAAPLAGRRLPASPQRP